MPIYEIPIVIRFINVTDKHGFKGFREKVLVHKGVGIFLRYYKEIPADIELKEYLVGVEYKKYLIKAQNLSHAIKELQSYDGAMIGGKGKKEKALWIDETKNILELPHCRLMSQNAKGDYVCGDFREDGSGDQGEYGMCVLEGYTAPENCPISDFYNNLNQKSVPFVMVGEFKVVESLSY